MIGGVRVYRGAICQCIEAWREAVVFWNWLLFFLRRAEPGLLPGRGHGRQEQHGPHLRSSMRHAAPRSRAAGKDGMGRTSPRAMPLRRRAVAAGAPMDANFQAFASGLTDASFLAVQRTCPGLSDPVRLALRAVRQEREQRLDLLGRIRRPHQRLVGGVDWCGWCG